MYEKTFLRVWLENPVFKEVMILMETGNLKAPDVDKLCFTVIRNFIEVSFWQIPDDTIPRILLNMFLGTCQKNNYQREGEVRSCYFRKDHGNFQRTI